MAVTLGTPVWTEGGFNRISALDDLGVESVGAGLLRRLLPGIVQTTPNTGYFSFYPYLVARWEDESDSNRRTDFKEFYRRREAAFALSCVLHNHRGRLIGVNGSSKASHALITDSVDVAAFAAPDAYMQSAYGGYGLFYARVISDVRLTELGAAGYVDRVTDRGRQVAEAFAETFEQTEYFRRFRDSDKVPIEVLAELGDATCLCTIPGRSDHSALVDTFFGQPEADPEWEDRRRTRMRSLGLFLEAHQHRPERVEGTVGMWRRMVLASRFPDGTGWATDFDEQRSAWRAYQLREVLVMALTSLWSSYLELLDEVGPTSHDHIRQLLVTEADWPGVGIDPTSRLDDAINEAERTLPAPEDLITDAEILSNPQAHPLTERVAKAFRLLLRVRTALAWDGPGFDPLIDEGDPGRWSLQQHADWLDARGGIDTRAVSGELVDAIYYQHRRIALSKVSPTDHRDPFCLADDNGMLTTLRLDDPFWTGARFGVVNHLLWTLGAIEDPTGDAATTPLGDELLDRCRDA